MCATSCTLSQYKVQPFSRQSYQKFVVVRLLLVSYREPIFKVASLCHVPKSESDVTDPLDVLLLTGLRGLYLLNSASAEYPNDDLKFKFLRRVCWTSN